MPARCRAQHVAVASVAVLCVGGASETAYAQSVVDRASVQLFRPDAAGSRPEPQFEPPPIFVAGLTVDAGAVVGMTGETNVYRSARQADGDLMLAASGSLLARADLGQSTVVAHAQGGTQRFFRLSRADADTYDFGIDGSIALGPHASAATQLSYARELEPRASSGANPEGASASLYRALRTSFTLQGDVGALNVSAPVNFARRTYEVLHVAGAPAVDQSFRDTHEFSVAPRLSYAPNAASAVFVRFQLDRLRTIAKSPQRDRSANSYALLGGIHFDLDHIVVAEAGLGWRARDYTSPRFLSFNGFTYDATVDWYPTELVSLRAEAHRSFENSGLLTVATIQRDTQRVSAYYDPLRRLRTSFRIERARDTFREIGAATTTWSPSVRASYRITPRLTATIYGQYLTKSSTDRSQIGAFHAALLGIGFAGRL